jgi:hypothetical protein
MTTLTKEVVSRNRPANPKHITLSIAAFTNLFGLYLLEISLLFAARTFSSLDCASQSELFQLISLTLTEPFHAIVVPDSYPDVLPATYFSTLDDHLAGGRNDRPKHSLLEVDFGQTGIPDSASWQSVHPVIL